MRHQINQQHIVYLHGFRSSPQSTKAQQFLATIASDFPTVSVYCPQLHHHPKQAVDDVVALVDALALSDYAHLGFVGSSLGGFYATWLADFFACKAVLINPAVRPDTLLPDYVGWQHNYHNPSVGFEVVPEHIDTLKQWLVQPIKTPENLWVLLQKGDMTLDYQDAVAWYKGCPMDIEAGGSHAYDDFVDKIPQIVEFLR